MYASPKALSRDGMLHKRSESVAGPLSGKANKGSRMGDDDNLNFSGVQQRVQANMTTNVNMGILTSPVEIKIQAKDVQGNLPTRNTIF